MKTPAFVQFQKQLCIILLLILFSCSDKRHELSKAILALTETGHFVTAEYTLGKVIRASDDKTWYKIGDRKIIITCEAYLKAGVDLKSITPDNFFVHKDSMVVTLPHAQLFSLSIPPDKIQVAYEDLGTFRSVFSAAEREELVAQAEPQILSLADSLGILQTAENNAATFMQHLFQEAGYKKTSVHFR